MIARSSSRWASLFDVAIVTNDAINTAIIVVQILTIDFIITFSYIIVAIYIPTNLSSISVCPYKHDISIMSLLTQLSPLLYT